MQVTLFSESDISTMFSIFDITGRGYVTQTQYHRGKYSRYLIKLLFLIRILALNAVGIEKPALAIPTVDKISKGTFVDFM